MSKRTKSKVYRKQKDLIKDSIRLVIKRGNERAALAAYARVESMSFLEKARMVVSMSNVE